MPDDPDERPLVAVVAQEQAEREVISAIIWVALGYNVFSARTLAGLSDRMTFSAAVVAADQLSAPLFGSALVVADSLADVATGNYRAVLSRPIDVGSLEQALAGAVGTDPSDDDGGDGVGLPRAPIRPLT